MDAPNPLAALDISRITATQIWQGCVLHTIFDGVTDLICNSRWDDRSWNIDLADGERIWEAAAHCFLGTFDCDRFAFWFEGNDVIAALFAHEFADRNPYRHEGQPPFTFDYHDVWRGMPDHYWPIVERELAPRMTIEDWEPIPAISGGVWSEGGYLRSAEPWPEIAREYGGWLLGDYMQDTETIVAEWAEGCDLSEEQVTAVRRIFERRITTPRDQPIVVTTEETDLLLIMKPEPPEPAQRLRYWEGRPDHGLITFRNRLATMGVIVP